MLTASIYLGELEVCFLGRKEAGCSSFYPIVFVFVFDISSFVVPHTEHGYCFDKDVLLLNTEALLRVAPCLTFDDCQLLSVGCGLAVHISFRHLEKAVLFLSSILLSKNKNKPKQKQNKKSTPPQL